MARETFIIVQYVFCFGTICWERSFLKNCDIWKTPLAGGQKIYHPNPPHHKTSEHAPGPANCTLVPATRRSVALRVSVSPPRFFVWSVFVCFRYRALSIEASVSCRAKTPSHRGKRHSSVRPIFLRRALFDPNPTCPAYRF